MSSYILDFNLLDEQKLSVDHFLTLLKIGNNDLDFPLKEDNILILEEKQLIKIVDDSSGRQIIIRENGKLLLDLVTIDEVIKGDKPKLVTKRSMRAINNDIDEFIDRYREHWKGIKLGSMGNLQACKDKMFKWMKENPQYTKEDILRAARTYIKSLDDYKYVQRADYFIYKEDKYTKSSRLSEFIEEVEPLDEGWSSGLK